MHDGGGGFLIALPQGIAGVLSADQTIRQYLRRMKLWPGIPTDAQVSQITRAEHVFPALSEYDQPCRQAVIASSCSVFSLGTNIAKYIFMALAYPVDVP